MNDKKNCKIVQDLFPSYIDNLTDIETNNFIEQHLKECDECPKLLEHMKESIKIDNKKANKRDIKYMKKFNKKLTFLLIIIYLIGFIIIASSVRKVVIIDKLSKNAEENYLHSTNYHYCIVSYSCDTDDYFKLDIYRKDDNIKEVSTIFSKDGIKKDTMYIKKSDKTPEFENYVYNRYTEDGKGKKIAILNQDIFYSSESIMPNLFETDNILKTFIDTIPVSIKSTKFNGKDCYFITNFSNIGMFSGFYGNGLYVDKETGLPIYICSRYDEGEKYSTQNAEEYKYEFNCVTDEEFIEPDISEYEISDTPYPSSMADSINFYKKFARYTGYEQNGKAIKKLLNEIVKNIEENSDDNTKLPDIIYIENNTSDTMKSKLTDKENVLDLDDYSSKEVSYTEVVCSIDGSFKYHYDKEASFKIVSDSSNTNKELIEDMMSKINEEDIYYASIAIDVDNDYTNEIDAIIINKR